MADALTSPLAQKVITALGGLVIDFLNTRFHWGLNPTAIVGGVISIIGGIALHNAAKDHGINVEGSAK